MGVCNGEGTRKSHIDSMAGPARLTGRYREILIEEKEPAQFFDIGQGRLAARGQLRGKLLTRPVSLTC
jgi:hypothetical protein